MREEAPLHLSAEAASAIREEVVRAKGREVSFIALVSPEREVFSPRAVARGNMEAVLAAAKDAEPGSVMIHNHPSGDLEPSGADLSVAASLYERGLGTAIVDNDAREIYVVVEPPEPRRRERLDVEALEEILSPGGALSAAHAAYEDREGQRTMLRTVAELYNEGGTAFVEAGTGTGKSLAYLLPAARWAIQNEERTVVSTNTINLQEQLVANDLPLVQELLGEEIEWALVKGRGNYVSIRRARLAAESAPELFREDRSAELDAVLDWIETTEDGSLADLAKPPSEEVWEEVRSDSDICLRARCPHFQHCFFQRSRREAASARILVVNHHLLFTDLAVRRATDNFTQSSVLPPYRHVVLDEAHNVEDAATSHLGVEMTRVGLFRLLARLDRDGKGILGAVLDRLEASPDSGEAEGLLKRAKERVRPAATAAREALGRFLDDLDPALPRGEGDAYRLGAVVGGGVGAAEAYEAREGEAPLEPVRLPQVREGLDALLNAMAALEREVGELRHRIGLSDVWAEPLEGRILDLSAIERRLQSARSGLRLVLDPGDDADSHVRWIERRRVGGRPGRNLMLAAAPIELGPLLRESLFQKVDSALLTSATLAIRGRFDFLRERVGLDQATLESEGEGPVVREGVVPSPFSFAEQSLFCVPTDLADPQTATDRLQEDTARVVADFSELTDGGLFVLFTSHRALREVARLLREEGHEARWPLFVQGEGDRARLLTRFVEAGSGILLGTASFWEGVDVPGHPLRGLIIQKLPFRVPTEPVTAARLESIERRGGDSFATFMLPQAALRLKQGFGRLIRSRDDHGAVLLLDDRITRKKYGRYLRESLPPAPFVKGLWGEVRGRLREFYGDP